MKVVEIPKKKRELTSEAIQMLMELTDEIAENGCSELFIVLYKPDSIEQAWCTTDGYSTEMLGHLHHYIGNYSRAYDAACDDMDDWLDE